MRNSNPCGRYWACQVGLGALVVALLGSVPALAREEAEAYVGAPFGVAKITVPILAAVPDAPETTPYLLDDPERRALYPAFSAGLLRRLLGGVLGGQGETREATAFFLFRGTEPFQVTFYTPQPVTVAVVPREEPRRHQRLLEQWWREYTRVAQENQRLGDYPPVVETYLTSMLARRAGVSPDRLERLGPVSSSDQLLATLELLAGTESMRLTMMREMMLGPPVAASPASLPVPPEIGWTPLAVPAFPAEVAIEPLALRVPEECFYIRFGRFGNYLWLAHLLERNGGDLSRLFTLRGHDPQLSQRVQRQLALKESELAELLGERVVADIALVGRDMYLQEGAALGVIFQANAPALLAADIARQRAAALAAEKESGATQTTLEIAGHQVDFLATPDNRLRSFHAQDGAFHLVTTSRAMVERFYAVAKGEGSLGKTAEFRYARSVMPLTRDDTVFAYLSTAFLRGLVSPQYQIERRRRLTSVVEMDLLQLAYLAALGERRTLESIDELVAAGFLAPGFGRRGDGSHLRHDRGRIVDSVRGPRGSFVPIPDLPLAGVTKEEAAEYATRAAFYAGEFRQMDPLMIGMRRHQLAREGELLGLRERVVIDAHVSPFVAPKYGWVTSMLGPPTHTRVRPDPDDVIFLSAFTQGGLFDTTVPPHHMFLGVQDLAPLGELSRGGILNTLRVLRSTPGYLGAWPKTGFIDRLPLGLSGGPPDAYGFSRLPLGLYRRQFEAFSVLAFDFDLLAKVTSRMRVEEAETPAQVRFGVGDLGAAKAAGWVNALTYVRARQASEGNVRLLAALSQQLHLPPRDAQEVAETLVDGRLVCSLGGEYQLKQIRDGHGYWVSDRWGTPSDREGYGPPAEFTSPVLAWFRGLLGEVTLLDDRLVARLEVDVERRPEEKVSPALPLFNLFPKAGSKDAGAKPAPAAEKLPAPATDRLAPRGTTGELPPPPRPDTAPPAAKQLEPPPKAPAPPLPDSQLK